jgi:hypothetical protein
MEEARATYCFCGCGDRVKHPRLVVTNTTGWELSAELAEWAKFKIVWSRVGNPIPERLQKNIDDGQDLWLTLADAIHSGERADKQDEATAVHWRKHAKKDRRKLGRQLRRGGMADPFDLPDLGAEDLNAWITEGQEPAWSTELVGYEPESISDLEEDDQMGLGSQLIAAALEEEKMSWDTLGPGKASWEEPAIVALCRHAVKSTDGSSEHYTLFVDAAHLGYWVRVVEREATEAVNMFDDTNVAELEGMVEKAPAEAIELGMGRAADQMPACFAPGTEAWNELKDAAMVVLDKRATRVLADAQVDCDADVDYAEFANRFSPEIRDLAFRLGYGMGMTVDSINIARLRPKEIPRDVGTEVDEASTEPHEDETAQPAEEVELRGVLLPEVMLTYLESRTAEGWNDDVSLLVGTYLTEALDLNDLGADSGDLVVTAAKAGYCTRSIAIDTIDQAREESARTTSLLEWNTENDEDDDPMFVVAARLAGKNAGLEEMSVHDPTLQATWLMTPGVGDIDWFKRLAIHSIEQTVAWFVDESPDFRFEDGMTDDMLFSSWLFGYFLRAQEQYAPMDNLFAGAKGRLEAP